MVISMVLDSTQELIIAEQLKKENISEFLDVLIFRYANDTNRTSHLLSLIPKIAETQLNMMKDKVIEHSRATNLLLGYDKRNVDFATLLYVSKVCFPTGNCDGASQVGKEFFNKFINAIKTKKDFDYTSKDDWYWICNVADCEEWMSSVIKQHIDEDSLENCDTKCI